MLLLIIALSYLCKIAQRSLFCAHTIGAHKTWTQRSKAYFGREPKVPHDDSGHFSVEARKCRKSAKTAGRFAKVTRKA